MGTGTRDKIPEMYRTLVANGYIVENVRSGSNHLCFECKRSDEFGVMIPYVFVLGDSSLSDASRSVLLKLSSRKKANLLFIGDSDPILPNLSWEKFLSRCGGGVKSWLPLQESFSLHLTELGFNRSVPEIVGSPNDLYEEYVHVALQFILAQQVVRYGQERRFEDIPDGIAFLQRDVAILYDAKAYGDGYPVEKSSVRQFVDYVRGFKRKYSDHIHIFACLVVSSCFDSGPVARQNKSNEVYAECGVKLTYITSEELGRIVQLFVENPAYRRVINWQRIFADIEVTSAKVEAAIGSAQRDGIVRG